MKIIYDYLDRAIAPTSLGAFTILAGAFIVQPQAKAADGTWILDANDTWDISNTTPWESGVVAEGTDFTADFSTIDITANRTVTLTNPLTIGNMTFGDTSGSQSWTLSGSTLTLDTTVGTPTITNTTGLTIESVLAGSGGLTKEGSGLLILDSANTYTGTTTINGGTLRLFNDDAVNGDIVMGGGNLSVENVSVTLSGNISGSSGGSIVKGNSASTLTLLGDNTSNTAMNLQDGTLILGSGINNGIGTGNFSISRGQVMSSDNTARTINNNIIPGSGNTTYGADQGATTGLGDLTFTDTASRPVGGSKNWIVNNDTVVTFNNSWGGNPGHDIRKQGSGTLVFNGNILGGSGGLRFRGDIIVNAGTLVLNGARTDSDVSSDTTINGGSLIINGDQSGFTGAVSVNDTGALGGIGTMGSAVTLNAGGAIAPGNSIGTLTANGGMVWNGETSSGGGEFAQMQMELSMTGGDNSSDFLDLGSGSLTKGTGDVYLFDFLDTGAAGNTYTIVGFGDTDFLVGDFGYTGLTDGLVGSFQLNSDSLQFIVVPEPGAYAAMMGLGMLALVGARRFRQRSSR